jgi:hypothetical protein
MEQRNVSPGMTDSFDTFCFIDFKPAAHVLGH